ncbi:MAG: hypothetical protein NW223_07715 [Hyphomicrobiaceae bacterium]|nr:hypothetical protein [Hyphomicrobiaceae bacterium]
MLDFTRSPAYADLGSHLTRLYANAALRTFLTVTSQGLMLWSGLLAASVPRPSAGSTAAVPPLLRSADPGLLVDWMRLALPAPWLAVPQAAAAVPAPAMADQQREESGTRFSAYRSDSGHAVAQVIVG